MKKTVKTYINNTMIIAISSWMIASCNSKQNETMEEEHHDEAEETIELTQAQYNQAEIGIGKVERRTIGSELKVNGIIDVPPQHNVSINIPYGGFVKHTEMLPGTRVKKGQFLVSIENPKFIEFQQEYLENLANQEFLKEEYERQQKLFKEKVASGKNFQQAKSNYLANEARIKAMEARLKLIGFNTERIKEGTVSAVVNLYAPVNGSVRDVYTNVGKYINPQDVIMDITNSDDLHVELTVYENDIPRISDGQRIRFTIANRPDDWREAEVFLIGSGVREDRSVTVHGHLKEKQADLIPGMYVAAKIEIGSSEVWAVPDESIVRFDGKHYIFSAKGQKQENGQTVHDFEMLEIRKGNTEDDYTQISLTDKAKDLQTLKLVTKGAFTLLAKAKNSEEEGGHGH